MLAVIHLTSTAYPNLARYKSEEFFKDPKNGGTSVLFSSIDDVPTKELSIVVPAYCEEERLPVMLDECLECLEDRFAGEPQFSYEVIVVDDGSPDKTSEVALAYSQSYGTDKVRVLTLEKNRGKGGAIRLGVFSARGKMILFADADGATNFQDLSKLEDKMKHLIGDKKDSCAVVCGSRAHLQKDSIAERSLFRTFLMYGFHFLVWFLCVRGIKDTQCGFKLLTRNAAKILFSNLHVERWAFDVDMLYIAQHFNMAIGEVAVRWTEIDGSKMIAVWSWLQMGRDILLIRLRYFLGSWKIDNKVKLD
ncbi:unnamed protein product [Owenia fusiformis]|nr:unnamed protein product [Owenia fusiformis]